jgi:copper chaperone CopZ
MQEETFTVSNVKCAGCVNNIKDGLKPLVGDVEQISVNIEQGQVTVCGEALSRETIAAKLGVLGYPEIQAPSAEP